MKTVGIVAEYNPFHSGHAYHIRETRHLVGEECTVVAVMSGDFVQRGEPAIYDKFTRAAAAVRGGADLVIELPINTSLSSAEGFARGAIQLLGSLHTELLSFGSETGELEILRELAELFSRQDFLDSVRAELKAEPEQSFASARQKTAERVLGRSLPELRQPNNILAVEYLKCCGDMIPIAVNRCGAGHDERGENDHPSAYELRTRLRAEGKGPDPTAVELLCLDRLRCCRREQFPEDGLGDRMFRESRAAQNYEDFLRACATRRYPLARVRRAALRAILNVQDSEPAYIRILAFNERGRALLQKDTALPLLTKPAHVKRLGESAQNQFETASAAHDFYLLLNLRGEAGADWKHVPEFVHYS